MATWSAIEARIMARFDVIEARLSDIETRLTSVDDRTGETADQVDWIRSGVRAIDEEVQGLGSQADALCAIEELAEDARRRERQQWLRESRAAMGRAS